MYKHHLIVIRKDRGPLDRESFPKRRYCFILIEKNKRSACIGYAAALMLLGGQMKFITIFLSVQDDKECVVLDGEHQELGHVTLTGKVEGDGGAAACRDHLREWAGGAGRTGMGAVRGWPCGGSQRGRSRFPQLTRTMLDQSYTAPVRLALGTSVSSH